MDGDTLCVESDVEYEEPPAASCGFHTIAADVDFAMKPSSLPQFGIRGQPALPVEPTMVEQSYHTPCSKTLSRGTSGIFSPSPNEAMG